MPYVLIHYAPDEDTFPIVEYLINTSATFRVETTFKDLEPWAEVWDIVDESAKRQGFQKKSISIPPSPLSESDVSPIPDDEIVDSPSLSANFDEQKSPSQPPEDKVGETQLTHDRSGLDQINGQVLLDSLVEPKNEDELKDSEEQGGQGMEQSAEDKMTESTPEFKCPVVECDAKFATFGGLKDHMDAHPSPLNCGICNLPLPHPLALRRHSLCHATHLFCIFCSKNFACPAAFLAHQDSHSVSPASSVFCFICGALFSSVSDFTAHLSTYAIRQFCPDCGRCFDHCAKLKAHAIIHTRRKFVRCETCLLEYATKTSLQRHNDLCHPAGERRMFECEDCRQQDTTSTFTTAKCLSQHTAKFHSE